MCVHFPLYCPNLNFILRVKRSYHIRCYVYNTMSHLPDIMRFSLNKISQFVEKPKARDVMATIEVPHCT